MENLFMMLAALGLFFTALVVALHEKAENCNTGFSGTFIELACKGDKQ